MAQSTTACRGGSKWLIQSSQQGKLSLPIKCRKKATGIISRAKALSPAAPNLLGHTLRDGRWFTKMTLFHGHSSTTGADIFHRCQFILAHMARISLGCATKTAFARISTGVAQMSRLIRYCATIFTTICHDSTPFSRKAISVQAKRSDFLTT